MEILYKIRQRRPDLFDKLEGWWYDNTGGTLTNDLVQFILMEGLNGELVSLGGYYANTAMSLTRIRCH